MDGTKAIIVGLVLLATMSAPARADNMNVALGYRALDDVWSPAADHQLIGFEYDRGPTNWPVHLSFGLTISSDRDEDSEGFLRHDMSVAELSFGVKKLWSAGRKARPFLCGGVSWVWNVHFEIAPIEPGYQTNDSSFGVYAGGGVLWRVGSRFNLGFDIRLMRGASATFTQGEGTLDCEQFGFLVGFNWGKDRD